MNDGLSIKVQFEQALQSMSKCLASVRAGVDLSEVDSVLLFTLRRSCREFFNECPGL